jgi:hypothetical protein
LKQLAGNCCDHQGGKVMQLRAHAVQAATSRVMLHCVGTQVVLFGKGSDVGFPFGKASVTLANTILPGRKGAQRYTAIGGSLGSTSVAAVMQQGAKGSAGKTVKALSFPASAVADGTADISKAFRVASGYGGSIVVVP